MIPQKRCLEGTSSNRFYTCSSCNIKQNNMYLSSCGCFYCESCVKFLPENHETCFSKSNKENFLLLEKQKPCKYQDQGCNSGAQFICKCIKNGFVCGSCLIELHVRRVDAPCLPVKIKNKSSSFGNCEDCKTFIAEFKVLDENKKVCIDCKIKYKNLEKIIDDEFDWEKIAKELEVTKNILNCKKKKINTLLEYRKNIFKAAHAKFDEVLEKIKGDFALNKKTFDHENQELVSCFDQIKKFEKNIGIDGSISQVITEAKKNLLEINGGYSALSALLKSYRDHDIPSFKIKEIKFDFIQHEDLHQYMISFDTQELVHAEATSIQLDHDDLETDEAVSSSRITRSFTPVKASKQIQEVQWQEYSIENDTTATTSRTLTLLDTNDPVCVQITRILSPFYICIEIPELVETRNEILEIIRSKENEWTPLASFGYNDIVIVSDEYAVKNKKKRGKVKYVNRIKEQVRVYLLDFGFDIMVPFKRIGNISGLENYENTPSTCFIGKLMNIMPLSKFIFPDNNSRCPTSFICSLAKKSCNKVNLKRLYKYDDIIFCCIQQDQDWSELLIKNKMAHEYKDNHGCFVPTRDYCYKHHAHGDCTVNCNRVHDCPFCSGCHSLLKCNEYIKELEIMSK